MNLTLLNCYVWVLYLYAFIVRQSRGQYFAKYIHNCDDRYNCNHACVYTLGKRMSINSVYLRLIFWFVILRIVELFLCRLCNTIALYSATNLLHCCQITKKYLRILLEIVEIWSSGSLPAKMMMISFCMYPPLPSGSDF